MCDWLRLVCSSVVDICSLYSSFSFVAFSCVYCGCIGFFFFKQKTAYEMRISDWSSDVCSSDLRPAPEGGRPSSPARIASPSPSSQSGRSEERRVGKSVSVRVDLGGRRIIKKKKKNQTKHKPVRNQQNSTQLI